MKTKIKRHSREVLAVLLSVCMLVSCFTVGVIATDAAQSAQERAVAKADDGEAVGAKDDSEEVGATTYRYLWYDMTNNNGQLSALTNKVSLSSTDDNYYTGSFSSNGNNIHFIINNSSSAHTSSSLTSSTTVTKKGDVASWTRRYENSGSYGVEGQLNSGKTYYIGYNVSTDTVIVGSSSTDTSGGGSADSDWYVIGHQFDTAWNTSGTSCKMTKDGSTGYFYYEKTFTANSNYYRIHDGTDQYGPANENVITLDTKYSLSTTNSGNAVQISSSLTGAHRVWWDPSSKKTWVSAVEPTHNVTFSVDSSAKGTISPSTTTAVGETTSTAVTATPKSGYQFSSWTNGTGINQVATTISGDSYTEMITTKSTGSGYTVRANFTAKSYTLTKGTETNGTFTVSAGGSTITTTGSVTYNSTITVTCYPATGYTVSSVAAGSNTGTAGENNVWTVKMPASNATLNVTFAKKDNAITTSANPTGSGTVWVGAASNTTYNNRKTNYKFGDTVYLRATPGEAYNFSKFVVIYADGTSEDITNVTTSSGSVYKSLTIDTSHFDTATNNGAISVVGYFTAKPTHTVTVKTNNVAYGTAIASVGAAYNGQEVTLTAIENTGTFSSWTVDSGGVTISSNKFTMGDSDVTITATFTGFSGETEWYYDGYNLVDGNTSHKDGYYAQHMTAAKMNGVEYSYYHVSGRTETDQLFTVSRGDPASSDSKYKKDVFFRAWNQSHGWGYYGSNPIAKYYTTDMVYMCEHTMEWDKWYGNENASDKVYKDLDVPEGARYIQFASNHNDDTDNTGAWRYTQYIDLYNGIANDNEDCFYIKSVTYNGSGEYNDIGSCEIGSAAFNRPINYFHEYFNDDSGIVYSNAWETGGFYSHNEDDHDFTKPNNLNAEDRGSYYVLVLYKDHAYTINGHETGVLAKDTVVWMKNLPDAVPDNVEKVDIFAKNGSLRDSTFNRFTNLANTDFVTDYFEYTEVLDSGVYTYTSIEDYNAAHSKQIVITNDVSGYNSTYATMTNVPIGAKIKLRTTLSSSSSDAGSFDGKAFKDTHYLKAYTFNGVTYEVHSANDTGVYEEIWTVRDVNTKSADGTTNLTKGGNTIEITPIYYMKDNSNCMTFYIDGYDATVQGAWGNLLSVYPYYENKSNAANAFGGYPGQPMLLWGGKYQMEIPLTVDGTATGATVKGLTLHNDFWDLLHRDKDLVCNKHAQTYDYDDFYKIYKEKNPDSIIFDFKYKTTKDNFNEGYEYINYTFANGTTGTAATYNGSDYNGVELLTDYYGRQVDAFGNLITTGQSNWDSTHTQNGELLFVSTGYKDTYVGEYATMWAVYAPNGSFIGYISPSMLYLSSLDRVAQYTDGTNTGSGRMSWSQFSNTYTTLKNNYTGTPVLISYEEEIWNDSKDKANRSDGKWYYANKSDKISANIIIQYNSNATQSAAIVASKDKALNDTAKWTEDTFSSTAGVGGYNNIGTTTTCAAYFTNTSPYLLGKVNSGEQFADSTKSFTFRADSSGDYMFVNWVRYSNGKYYEISEKELAESVMSSNDTYIARFVKSSSGSLKISHVVEQNSTYTGSGTPAVTVTVKSANDTQVFSKTSTDGTPIDISSYIQTKFSGYKIDISLSTTPDADCTLAEIVTSAATKYRPDAISNNAATVSQFTVEDIIDDNVSNLRYVSHLNTIEYTYNYSIVYTYPSRFWGNQSYTVTGSLSSINPEQIANISGKKGDAKLTTDFIIDKTPYEKNFRQQINWNYTDSAVGGAAAMTNGVTASSGTTYTISATVQASSPVDDSVTAEFVLPYNHTSKETGATIIQGDMYETAEDVDPSQATKTNIYDTSYESVTLTTKAYSLFTYNGVPTTGGDDTYARDLALIEAPEYLIKDANWHYHHETKTRYFSSDDKDNPGYQSFMIGNDKYWLNKKPSGAAGTVLTESSTASFNETTYTYAVLVNNTGGYTQELYRFINVGQENVQYTYTSWVSSINGIIHDEAHGGKYYFTRWDVYNTKGEFVASCYNRKFTFSGYDSYVIRPIYETAPDANGNNPNNYASATGTSSSGTSAEITFLGDTRNQWNSGGAGNYRSVTGKTDGDVSGDKLIQDFAITYSYEGKEIQKIPSSEHQIKIGMIIEKLGALDSASGTKVVDPSYYANKYKGDVNAAFISGIATALSSGGSISNATGHSCANSKIGANVDGWGTKFGTSTTTALNFNSVIDNFNRLQWFYTFNNTKTNGEIGNTNNANFAYRAWAYIIVDSTATVSSTPTYFTMYDSASR